MKSMNRKLLLSVLALCLALCAVSCQPTQTPPPAPESGEQPLFPSEYEDGDYRYNPKATSAVLVGENTVRVSFDMGVSVSENGLDGQVTLQLADGSSLSAEDYRLLGVTKDASTGKAYGTVIDFLFPSSVSSGVSLVFTEKKGDGDRALGNILSARGGAGLMADEGGKLTLTVGKDAISTPDEPVQLIRARIIDKERGQMKVTFSEPVCCLTGWDTCVFVSDVVNPNPGVGGSWQYTIKKATAVDGERGQGGRTYAEEWVFVINADMNLLPRQGVLRISENDPKATAEFQSPTDNADCGRVVLGKSGKPLLAEFIGGWDVAFVPYEL